MIRYIAKFNTIEKAKSFINRANKIYMMIESEDQNIIYIITPAVYKQFNS